MGRSRLRLLVVADSSPIERRGGSVRVIREQCRRLKARGHDCVVLCREPWYDAPAETEADGVPVHHFRVSRAHALSFFFASIGAARRAGARLLAQGGWDAVIFHQPLSAYGVGPLATRLGIPYVYFFHSPAGVEYQLRHRGDHLAWTVSLASPALRWVERRALKRATQVIVLSDFSRLELHKNHGEVSPPVVKIPGGVDCERFRPAADRAHVRERLGLPPDGLLLLTVRDLEPRMGIDNLIRAMVIVLGEIPAMLVIGGRGELQAPLTRLARRLRVDSSVRFAGFIHENDLPSYYQAADLFVLPTRALEGFGLVTAEALACGTPVLGTPVGATPEILLSLDPDLITRDASPEAIADGIIAFARRSNPGLRERCRAHAEAHFSWERVVDALEATLSQMI
ncbi:MAG TPA: glycosyltransferase family 4 protein [Methylomirabilota bacterium]|nr:glycosyltransferase family 4 protein [Methylomirabilota bacterium]